MVCVGNFNGAVVGANAGEIVLHHRDDSGCARPDRRVQIVDRRLFEAKWRGLGFGLVQHRRSSSGCLSPFRHIRPARTMASA
jgi:hypothetical protein